MAVGIDDRMRELCVHLRGAEMTIAGQGVARLAAIMPI
jgi:hypothetical protein